MIVKHISGCTSEEFERDLQALINKVLSEPGRIRNLSHIKYGTATREKLETYFSALLIFE
jgi:hypothetical protein